MLSSSSLLLITSKYGLLFYGIALLGGANVGPFSFGNGTKNGLLSVLKLDGCIYYCY